MAQMTTYSAYLETLHRMPIQNPTAEDFAAVCPHLTPSEITEVFTLKDGESHTFVAVPPIKVKRGHLVVQYSNYTTPRLNIAFGHRTLASYADGKKHGDMFYGITYQEKAMQYAEDMWPEMLILDTWVDIGTTHIQDPTQLSKHGEPKTLYTVMYGINRKWNDLIKDSSAQESVLWNNAIVVLTTDPIEKYELIGGRGGFTEFNCAYCGGGLSLTQCTKCGNRFRDNQYRCGWSTPLPSKIVELVQSLGHTFVSDPKQAWEEEQTKWKQHQNRKIK